MHINAYFWEFLDERLINSATSRKALTNTVKVKTTASTNSISLNQVGKPVTA